MTLHRVDGVLDIQQARSWKLIFFGEGSLGSAVTAMLGTYGSRVVLVDPDILGEENVERHLLGLDEVGNPKVEGVKRWLLNRGVSEDLISTHIGLAQDVFDEHTDATLALVCVDNKRARADINAWCKDNNIPALYGGIYPKGAGGQVIVITDPSEVCYVCVEGQFEALDHNEPQPVNYGIPEEALVNEDNDPSGVPALRWSVDATASDMAMLAFEILRGENVPAQILVQAHGWDPVLNLADDDLKVISSYILAQPRMGLVPNTRLKAKEGNFQLLIHHAKMALSVSRWNRCTIHEKDIFSLEDLSDDLDSKGEAQWQTEAISNDGFQPTFEDSQPKESGLSWQKRDSPKGYSQVKHLFLLKAALTTLSLLCSLLWVGLTFRLMMKAK